MSRKNRFKQVIIFEGILFQAKRCKDPNFEIILDEKEANKQVTRKCHIRCQSVENFYFIMEHQNVTEWVVKKLIHTDTIERTGLSMIPYEIRILMSQFRQ